MNENSRCDRHQWYIWSASPECPHCRYERAEARVKELEAVTDLHALTTVMQEQQRLQERVERAEASAKAWEENALLRAKNEASRRRRAFWHERRVKELEEAMEEVAGCLPLTPMTALKVIKRALREEE